MSDGSRSSEISGVYLGLGSNLGDREANLQEARERIEKLGHSILRASSIYETEPVGYADQPWFLNQVIEVRLSSQTLSFETAPDTIKDDPSTIAFLQAGDFLESLLDIERDMGRERIIVNGPRVIDIDLLLLGEMILAETTGLEMARAEIIVPHPRMHLRRFVLEPLCEIAPDLIHPGTGKTISDLLAELNDPAIVRVYERKGGDLPDQH